MHRHFAVPLIRKAFDIFIIAVLLAALASPTPALAGDNVWVQSSQGMWGGDVSALALSPSFASDNTLFAGTYGGGVFKSTDGGATGQRSTRVSPT